MRKGYKPSDPAAEGWTFGGWYVDPAFSTEFKFNTAITADTVLYARWLNNAVPPVNPDIPQTGDNSRMSLWIALLHISGGALVGTAIYSRKRKTGH